MPRKLRLEYAGAIYHVMNRGDRRESIFLGEEDRQLFVETLGEACQKTGWQVHAYCLMGNHFHLVVETPRGNLVAGMRWFLGTYTARFNRLPVRAARRQGRSKRLAPRPRRRSRLQAEAQGERNLWSGGVAREAGHPLDGELHPRWPARPPLLAAVAL